MQLYSALMAGGGGSDARGFQSYVTTTWCCYTKIPHSRTLLPHIYAGAKCAQARHLAQTASMLLLPSGVWMPAQHVGEIVHQELSTRLSGVIWWRQFHRLLLPWGAVNMRRTILTWLERIKVAGNKKKKKRKHFLESPWGYLSLFRR